MYLNTHLHGDRSMGIISLYNEIIVLEPSNPANLLWRPLKPNRRERPRLPLQLHLERINMVFIHVCVSELDYQLFGRGIGNVGEHVGEQGVGCDVEWDSEAEVGGALVHETGEGGFWSGVVWRRRRGKMDVELREEVARRKRHLWDICDRFSGFIEESVAAETRGVPAGFQALKIILRSVGSSLIFLTTSSS